MIAVGAQEASVVRGARTSLRLVLLAALSAASCGAPLVKLPAGPGEPAPDSTALLAQATAACTRISALSVELGVRGSVGGSRMRGRLLVGVAGSDGLYIEAPAPFGAPIFVLGATGGSATLLLPRDKRVVERETPNELLEAIAGVPLDAASLRSTLTGCAPSDATARTEARRLGENWRIIPGPPTLYLKRERAGAPWRLASVVRSGVDGWRTDYSAFADDLPRTVRMVSNAPRRFDLRLDLSQLEPNPSLDPATFRVVVPAGTQPMSLEELRAGGPISK
jgi:hypothetical protein